MRYSLVWHQDGVKHSAWHKMNFYFINSFLVQSAPSLCFICTQAEQCLNEGVMVWS